MDKQIFWVCYLIFMAAIVLLPVIRNIYSHIKYNMSFAKHDKYIIDKFCENDPCIYMSKYMILTRIVVVVTAIGSIMSVCYATFVGYKDIGYMNIVMIAAALIVNISTIYLYLSWLYEKCVITSTSMLIRSISTKFKFTTVQLHNIVQHQRLLGMHGLSEGIFLLTKDNIRFSLVSIEDYDELIDVLKKFSNSIYKI